MSVRKPTKIKSVRRPWSRMSHMNLMILCALRMSADGAKVQQIKDRTGASDTVITIFLRKMREDGFVKQVYEVDHDVDQYVRNTWELTAKGRKLIDDAYSELENGHMNGFKPKAVKR